MKISSCLLLILSLSLAGGNILSAQDSIYSAMKTRAWQLFDDRKYETALPVYRDLLYRFPKEPEYQYGTALCLIKLNREPAEAISLLRSVINTDYNPMSHYYLGLLLHRNYMFDEAISEYAKYKLSGRYADVRALDVDRQIGMAKNGLEITRIGKSIRVLDLKTLRSDQLGKASEINGSGKLIKKPVEFCSKNDLKEGYRPLMFLPAYNEMNEYVFTSGYEKHKKGLRQIYRIRNINHETWSVPEPLDDDINSPYDEEFPYFDSRTSVLYFSSKGHSSMGGYDIFRSVYNNITKSWSAPENLGFPINSPYDDFFFLTGESQTASFVSNRNTGPGEVTLYKIRMKPDTAGIRLSTPEEMQNASRLQIEYGREQAVVPEGADQKTNLPSIPEPAVSRKNYNKVLSDALNMQLTSDSLGRIVRDKRLAAKENMDEEHKKQLVTDIIRLDKEAKRLQREADQKFEEARNMKEEEKSMIPKDTVEITHVTDTPPAKDTITLQDEFTISDRPYYNPTNPIPKGLSIHKGLVYRIQLGAFSRPRSEDAFGGVSPVCYEQVTGSGILKYYAGLFYSLNGVMRALDQVKKTGFPDAFIVAFLDGSPISTEKAKELEFEGMRL